MTEKDCRGDALDQALGWAIDSLRASTACARNAGDLDMARRLSELERKTVTMLEGFRRELAEKRDRSYAPRVVFEPTAFGKPTVC